MAAFFAVVMLASAWWTQRNADEYWLITSVSSPRVRVHTYARTYAAISAQLFSDLVRSKSCAKIAIYRRGVVKVWKCYSR